jgi:CHAT domain-containing protein
MWLLILLLGFFQFNTPTDSENRIVEQSQSQAEYYIQQIQEGNDTDKYLWALTVLSTSNPRIKTFVETKVKAGAPINNALSLFPNIEESYEAQLKKIVFKTGSADLLIPLLLSEGTDKEKIYTKFVKRFDFSNADNIDYKSICRAIINQKRISADLLSTESFHLAHFFLISDKNRRIYFSENYLGDIADKWQRRTHSNNQNSLKLEPITLLQSLYLLSRYSEITPLYRSVLASELFPNATFKLRLYRYIDYSVYRTGRYDRNLALIRNYILPLSKYLNDKATELSTRQLLGVYLYSIGKLQQAKNKYQEVLAEVTDSNISINHTSLYNNLGITYLKLGEYDKYLELQFQALETAKQEKNYSHQLDIYLNLFIYYRQAKNFQNALAYLEEVQNIAKKIKNYPDLGRIYIVAGSFYRKFKKDYQKAHSYFQRASTHIEYKNDNKYYIELLNEQAETYEQQQKFEQALAKHDRILELTSQKASNPTYIDALVNKAMVNLKLGRTQIAKKLIEQFDSFQLQQLDFEQIVKANTVKADFLNRKGKSGQALQLLNPTIDQLLERAQSSTDVQSGFWHIANEYLDALNLAVSIYLQQDKPEKAVAILDNLKTINDASIYQNPLVKSSLLNESELTQYKNLTSRLDAKRKELLTASSDKKFAIEQNINELELKKRTFDRRISSQVDDKPASISAIQAQLSARQLVLHITELKDHYYVAEISRSDVTVNVIPFDEQSQDLFTTAVHQVANHSTNLDSLYAISKLLEIQNIPDRVTDITVIPDSYLYQLPIDILPLEKPAHRYSYGATTYFTEKYKTHYLTSLDALTEDDRDTPKSDYRWNYTGYGISNFSTADNQKLVPLPFAEKEVTAVKNQLTNLKNMQTFTNKDSKKKTFTNTASQTRVLHLATHSEISERDPLFSTIYLSQEDSSKADESFSNQLFAYELFGLNLNNDMIMLNSCKSASGSYIQGTGIMGFSRALQYAGANALILNTWSVNDMLASDFAIHLYGELNKGKSKAEALQSTKRYFLASKNANPHFWGPYMLIGDTNPIIRPHRSMNIAMAGSFIFYFMLLVLLSYLKHKGIIFQPKKQIS